MKFIQAVLLAIYLKDRTVNAHAHPRPFGTVNSLGQNAEHEHITRSALSCTSTFAGGAFGPPKDCFETSSIDQLAGRSGAPGAIGAPDVPPELDAAAHCDDADFLDIPGYPQSRVAATAALQACIDHARDRITNGIDAAREMLDKDGKLLVKAEVEGTCTFTFGISGKAKCNTIEGFGRALHGIQDFYSHSNWVDQAAPGSISDTNPPGLGLSAPSFLFNLRSIGTVSPPHNLTTGCFAGPAFDRTPGANGPPGFPDCRRRVTHHTLNKDTGSITDSGVTSIPSTDRGMIGNNFQLAVEGAIIETRRQWKDFQDRLKTEYGSAMANLMICALTKDDPMKDCQGRKIAIVVDSSSSNLVTDPSNLRVAAAVSLNDMLITKDEAGDDGSPDLVTVIDFDTSARVLYPLGDPSGATFSGIDSSGSTFIAGGVAAAVGELTSGGGVTKSKTGIVVLTDGEDFNVNQLVAEVNNAQSLGIRVSFGFLSPPPIGGIVRRDTTKSLKKRAASPELLAAILNTGGIYGTINSAEAQAFFIQLVVSHGLTDIDNPNPGNGGSTTLFPGITVASSITPDSAPVVFTYSAAKGENLTFTVDAADTGALGVVLRDVGTSKDIQSTETDTQGLAVIGYIPSVESDLELLVSPITNVTKAGIFNVGLASDKKFNETTSSASSTTSSTTETSVSVGTSSSFITNSVIYPNTTMTQSCSDGDVTETDTYGAVTATATYGDVTETDTYGDITLTDLYVTKTVSCDVVTVTDPYGVVVTKTVSYHVVTETVPCAVITATDSYGVVVTKTLSYEVVTYTETGGVVTRTIPYDVVTETDSYGVVVTKTNSYGEYTKTISDGGYTKPAKTNGTNPTPPPVITSSGAAFGAEKVGRSRWVGVVTVMGLIAGMVVGLM